MQTISLKLPDDLMALLEGEAKARGVSKSQVIRESLESALRTEQVRDRPSCYDLGRDIFGSIKDDVPADIATNPKYMEGFGE